MKDLSILIVLTADAFKNSNDEYPVPKSSIAILYLLPNTSMKSWTKLFPCPSAPSVISSSISFFSIPYLANSFSRKSIRSSSVNDALDKLTEIVPNFIFSFFSLLINIHTCLITYLSIYVTKPFFSAIGINTLGEITSPVSATNLIKASLPIMFLVFVSYFGW